MNHLSIATLAVGPLQENTHLIGHTRTANAVLVDPGDESQRILDEAERRQWSIEWIVLTHGHIDHFAAAAAIQSQTQAKIAAPEGDAERFRDPELSGANLLGFQFEPVNPDVRLSEDASPWNALEREWRILDTPGHTPGHICLYSEPDALLIGGDLIFAGSVGRTDLPGGSWEALAASLREKIFKLPGDTRVLTGHGPETTLERERQSNPFVHHALQDLLNPMF